MEDETASPLQFQSPTNVESLSLLSHSNSDVLYLVSSVFGSYQKNRSN